jgi:predicted TPR repeat methyltransferase
LALYDKALALNSDLPHAWLGRGNVFCILKRYDEALDAYGKALAQKPDFAEAWLGRGNVLCELKRHDDALDAYGQALAQKPDFAEAWLGRGNVLCELKRHDGAVDAYGKALAQKPDFAEAWHGRGNVFHDLKRYDDALAAYDKALALNPDFASAWIGRGDALRLLRRAQDSIEAYRQALKLGGDVESITYYLAALGAEPRPAAPPERFVANLFDSYAENFEQDLVVNLKYGMPILLADAIKRYASSNTLDILDMGCGTGLMGEHIHPLARTLTGIDLSANMLEKARQREIYDQLFCRDLVEFLQTQDKIFDLAVAADVFVYLGDLSLVFQGVRRALRERGLFCFSVEATDEGDFVLRSTLRYAHSVSYLRRLAARYQFIVETIEPQVVRRDAGANINGYLAVMRCS